MKSKLEKMFITNEYIYAYLFELCRLHLFFDINMYCNNILALRFSFTTNVYIIKLCSHTLNPLLPNVPQNVQLKFLF